MEITRQHRERATAALKSLFIGDALAMPVHWYYNPQDIARQFSGGVGRYEAAPKLHPSSIMSLHSTSHGGRGGRSSRGKRREIVGDVILKGKRQYWDQPNQHYHRGMQAGENTLNACCARAVIRALTADNGHYDKELFLDAYIGLMTAEPARHRDTYAESYHRGFFANLEQGKPREQCGAATHDTASIGGLVTIAPIALAEFLRGTELVDVQKHCRQHLGLTHPDESLARVCDSYVQLLFNLLFVDELFADELSGGESFAGESEAARKLLSEAASRAVGVDIETLLRRTDSDHDVIGRKFSPACYISGSWPGVLYLAYKYRGSVKAALLANTNLGGDNVHRGCVLGVLVALASRRTDEELFAGLVEHEAIRQEIDGLINVSGGIDQI